MCSLYCDPALHFLMNVTFMSIFGGFCDVFVCSFMYVRSALKVHSLEFNSSSVTKHGRSEPGVVQRVDVHHCALLK